MRQEFKNLYVKIAEIPAFIIWKDSLTNNEVISLEKIFEDPKLENKSREDSYRTIYESIYGVVKHITSAIEEGKSLSEVAEIGRKRVKSYCDQSRSTIYNLTGQFGAVGPGASAESPQFNQYKQNAENKEEL